MKDGSKGRKLILGVTGGVGSGKSRVLDILKEDHGFQLIRADEVAKDLMQPGMECYRAVVEFLGGSILKEDGSIDRPVMADIIFRDPAKRQRIDELTHPTAWRKTMEEAKASYSDRVVIEAAVPSKEFRDNCSEMWYVYTSEEARAARLAESRGYAREKTIRIMENQAGEAFFRSFADVVIDNNGPLEETRLQVERALERLRRKF